MYKPRDYSKPLIVRFKGINGLKAYVKLLKTPPVNYDADKEAKNALINLKKQGAKL